MSEPIPESIPTSADPRSKRPTKKARPSTAVGAQNQALTALFEKQPDIQLPESATRGPKTTANLPPPPEIVANVQGSSAGAGSGEFHVYKASRRREHERVKLMEQEASREEADKLWQQKQQENQAKEEAKASKNKKRREKAKERKTKSKTGEEAKHNGDTARSAPVKKLQPRKLPDKREDEDDTEPMNGVVASPSAEEQGIVVHDDDT
ncbi:MAG: hypothetical protein M1831_003812 [Alyxoria varia]|nr:MAG: hypothetical protein M1831_003812 [Alyxoria varia]